MIKFWIYTHPLATMLIYTIGCFVYIGSIFIIAKKYPYIAESKDSYDMFDSDSIFGAMPAAVASWVGVALLWLYTAVVIIVYNIQSKGGK